MTKTLALISTPTASRRFAAAIPADFAAWSPVLQRAVPYAAVAIVSAGWFPWQDISGAAVMAVIGLAAMLSSIAGFAFSPICGAMLFHLVPDPVRAVQMIIVCSIAMQAAMTWELRRDIDWRGMRRYLAGGACGVPVGVSLLLTLQRGHYTLALGVFLIAFALILLLRKPFVVHGDRPVMDFVMAFLGGVTGGAAGFPSGPLAIWCGSRGWSKARQRAICQPFILTMQVLALALISALRPGAGFEVQTLLFVPASLLGTMAGMAIYRRLSDRRYGQAVNVLLLVAGLGFVL